MYRSLRFLLCSLAFMAFVPAGMAQDNSWPRTIPLEQGMVTIYQLQVDELKDDILHFRAALAYRETADAEPVFGAGWFESRVEIDRKKGIVHPRELSISDTRFPDGTPDVKAELTQAFATQSSGWNLDFSLDDLQASLDATEEEKQAVQNLNTKPPQIIYRDHPALLISIDGDPVLRKIENSSLEAVINTPYPLIKDGKNYYLNAARDVWYRSKKATGPYQFEPNPPADVAAMVKEEDQDSDVEQEFEQVTAANAPEIVVTTRPTELIVTEGPADFVPLVEDLLVLQNSEDDVFMHVSTQQYYIVLSGRWYHSGSLNGPWAYRAADELPTAFANIPKESDQSASRVYVAGTEEAHDAVLDAQVPQTAAVKRGEVDIDVEYDGKPSFEPVEGTDMRYADNTGSTVLRADRQYFLVEDGVWYVSDTANGPWQVADTRPAQVVSISPRSPVYNVKYVYIYDSTPDLVYVGYTPGYTGSYVYYNTIVYGTGWYYQPWVSPYYYYPRYSTWGFNVNYNPWFGWNFGLSWGWGPFYSSYYPGGYWHHRHHWHHSNYGYWGPGGYRPRPVYYGGHAYNRGDYGRSGRGRDGYGRNGGDRGDYGRDGRGRDDHGRNGRGRGDYGHDGRGRDGEGRGSFARERDRNLYRDNGQRARVVNTRDYQPAGFAQRDGVSRQANNYGAPVVKEQKGKARDKAGRSKTEPIAKTGPVTRTDLREKAQVRDINNQSRQNEMLADGKGRVYRNGYDGSQQRDSNYRNSAPVKGQMSRPAPAPRETESRQPVAQVASPPSREPQSRDNGAYVRQQSQQRTGSNEGRQQGRNRESGNDSGQQAAPAPGVANPSQQPRSRESDGNHGQQPRSRESDSNQGRQPRSRESDSNKGQQRKSKERDSNYGKAPQPRYDISEHRQAPQPRENGSNHRQQSRPREVANYERQQQPRTGGRNADYRLAPPQVSSAPAPQRASRQQAPPQSSGRNRQQNDAPARGASSDPGRRSNGRQNNSQRRNNHGSERDRSRD